MSNGRKLADLMVGTNVVATNVDSDLSTKISSIKTRLDSDDAKLQSLDTAINAGIQNLADSDLIINQLQAKINSVITNIDSDSSFVQSINTQIGLIKSRLDSDDAKLQEVRTSIASEILATNTDITTIKGRLDSDSSKLQQLDSSIVLVKTRLDSDDNAIQAASILASATAGAVGISDSDLKVVADLRNHLDSEIESAKSFTLSYTNYIYNATAGQTSFTGTDSNSLTLAYTAGTIQVFLNGIRLESNDYTATNGTTVVLTEAAQLGHQITILVPKISSNYVFVPPPTYSWSNAPVGRISFQPSNAANADDFTRSVAIDRNYAIFGASGRSDGYNTNGAAYVYYKSSGVWSQQAYITGQFAMNYGNAGTGTAIGGTSEGTLLAIGGFHYNNGNGRVAWYTRSGTTWSHVANADGATSSFFGFMVRMSGDTTVVGARNAGGGRVWVYTGNGVAQANFTSSDVSTGDRFGDAIDIDGDLIVVGAPYDDNGGTDRGSVYVFERSGTTWTEKAKLVPASAQAYESMKFGQSVACHQGEDGTNTIAVSEYHSEGYVYVFTGSGTSYTQQAKFQATDTSSNDHLGGNEGEGLSFDKGQPQGDTLFAGAPGHDLPTSGDGAVYIFTRSGTSWSQTRKLSPFQSSGQPNFGNGTYTQSFGRSIGVDEHGSLVVGAGSDYGGAGRGVGFILDTII